jgi:hypothetical protein
VFLEKGWHSSSCGVYVLNGRTCFVQCSQVQAAIFGFSCMRMTRTTEGCSYAWLHCTQGVRQSDGRHQFMLWLLDVAVWWEMALPPQTSCCPGCFRSCRSSCLSTACNTVSSFLLQEDQIC